MISDAELLFADAAEFDVATATPEISTNVYDTGPLATGNAGINLGVGEPLYGVIIVDTAFSAASTDGTITFTFESSAAAALTSSVIHWTSGAIAEATLAAGYTIIFPLPPHTTYLRYVGFRVTAATQNFSAGNATMVVTRDPSVYEAAASGLNFA